MGDSDWQTIRLRGQQAIRIYDPDGHVIEVGEAMDFVVKRFYEAGMNLEAIAQKAQFPVKQVAGMNFQTRSNTPFRRYSNTKHPLFPPVPRCFNRRCRRRVCPGEARVSPHSAALP